jgi:hypothetical protein
VLAKRTNAEKKDIGARLAVLSMCAATFRQLF